LGFSLFDLGIIALAGESPFRLIKQYHTGRPMTSIFPWAARAGKSGLAVFQALSFRDRRRCIASKGVRWSRLIFFNSEITG